MTSSAGDGAIALYSAVGDALAGRRLGFGRSRAALAARFAAHRGAGADSIAASWFAGALAEIGLVDVVRQRDSTERARALAVADAPLFGARIVAGISSAPPLAADIVRWYREHDDGTGVPDRLRWDGIPADAGALGITHAFLEAVEDPEQPRGAGEALFVVMAESGRRFRVELVRSFREFVGADLEGWAAPFDPALPAGDEDALLVGLATRIDARYAISDARSVGRSDRLAMLAASIAARLELDTVGAARLARLLALGRVDPDISSDDFDPLSRFARERRARAAQRAGAIAGSVPGFHADATLLASSAAWHEDGALEPMAAVLALALAVDALPPLDAPRRIAAAAGTQFDPAVARAYLTAIGAAR